MKIAIIVIAVILFLRYFVLPIYIMCWCEYQDWQREKRRQIKKILKGE